MYCQNLLTETGWFCIQTNAIITYSGQQGTPQCILKPGSTNLCQSLGQCIDWYPVTNTNVSLPQVIMTTSPTTNSVCRTPPPPGG
jgi:hypothetical protein